MQNIGNVSILGMFIMYFFTAIFGYLTFYGEETSLSHVPLCNDIEVTHVLYLCVCVCREH